MKHERSSKDGVWIGTDPHDAAKLIRPTGDMDDSMAMGRMALVRRGTAEVLSEAELGEKLAGGKRLSAYLGRAITGPLHLGHLVSISKLLDLQRANITAIVLLADIHAALDDQKSKWEELEVRREYTRKAIELSVDWQEMPRFVLGSDFQTTKEYQMDIFRFSTLATVRDALHAASEVTRMKNPKVSELIYPIMQGLDEQYLGVDIQLGGTDQRHIMVFARKFLPMLGYERRVELMMPLIPSLKGPGVKMSSSLPGTNIKVNASEEEIRATVNGAYCPAGVIQDNPLTAIANLFVLPNEGSFTIARPEKFGGDLVVNSQEQLNEEFASKRLHPVDLKWFLADYLIRKLARAREYFEANQDLINRLGPQFK